MACTAQYGGFYLVLAALQLGSTKGPSRKPRQVKHMSHSMQQNRSYFMAIKIFHWGTWSISNYVSPLPTRILNRKHLSQVISINNSNHVYFVILSHVSDVGLKIGLDLSNYYVFTVQKMAIQLSYVWSGSMVYQSTK